MCTVLLPPCGNPITVNKYRVSIKSSPDYKYLLQENYVEYNFFFQNVTLHKILETKLMIKKSVCILRSFLVINVCIQGKILCSPCISCHITLRPTWIQFRAWNVHNSLLVREDRHSGSCTLLSSGNEFLSVLSVLTDLGEILYKRDVVKHVWVLWKWDVGSDMGATIVAWRSDVDEWNKTDISLNV